MRNTIGKFGRKALVAAMPLAVAAMFASSGTASAAAPVATQQPVAIVQTIADAAVTPDAPAAPESAQPVALQDITTNPNAANHDPLGNGAAAGAIVGAAFGAVVCGVTIIGIPLIPLCMLGPAFQGALVGLIVGAVAPDVIPQVLP